MPRLRAKFWPVEKKIERRAEQAVRAIRLGKATLANEVRVARHVETLAVPDRERWLTLTLGDVHPSTVSVLQMCEQADMDREAEAQVRLYEDPIGDKAEEMHDLAHDAAEDVVP